MTEYKTSDFTEACFLYTKGLVYSRIVQEDLNRRRCTFVFTIPESIDINSLLLEWGLPENQIVRDILYKSKLLKTELKRFFESH